MSGEFCDWEPCHWLQKFVMSMLPKDRTAFSVQADTLNVPLKSTDKTRTVKRVTFYYCPFCGTRLVGNKEILAWINKKRGSS